MQVTAAKPLNTPQPALPAGQASTDRPVRLQALIDLDGIARRIVYIGGPAVLADAAIDAVREWTAEPARLNGAPVITPVTLQVKFGPR
jgi:outer membrane biosynthesis protein TonB